MSFWKHFIYFNYLNNVSFFSTSFYFYYAAAKESGRTFGAIKRFQSALLPIMYKLGVMSAVIFMTLLLAFKSVLITKLILILNLTFFAIKLGAYLKHDHGHHLISHSGWSPPAHGHGWAPHKDVHLHIHNGHGKPEYTIPYSTLSGGWDAQPHASGIEPTWSSGNSYATGRSFGSGDDLTPLASTQQTSTRTFHSINSNSVKPKIIEKRSDREPTIVMAQTNHDITPYNYLNPQNRK